MVAKVVLTIMHFKKWDMGGLMAYDFCIFSKQVKF